MLWFPIGQTAPDKWQVTVPQSTSQTDVARDFLFLLSNYVITYTWSMLIQVREKKNQNSTVWYISQKQLQSYCMHWLSKIYTPYFFENSKNAPAAHIRWGHLNTVCQRHAWIGFKCNSSVRMSMGYVAEEKFLEKACQLCSPHCKLVSVKSSRNDVKFRFRFSQLYCRRGN